MEGRGERIGGRRRGDEKEGGEDCGGGEGAIDCGEEGVSQIVAGRCMDWEWGVIGAVY